MARQLCIEYPVAVYQVTVHGVTEADIYLDEPDPTTLPDVYAHVSQRFHWRSHAHCLMTNRYHFVIETPEGNLSKGMRQLNGMHTQ
jgi:hypothetical protein